MKKKPPRILIVDDSVVFAMELEETLETLGFRVDGSVSNGIEAVKFANEKCPDVILMDIQMPGKMDGISAAHEILEDIEIPIIFVTGHTEEKYIRRTTSVSMSGYIVKPLHPKQLQCTIEIALQKANRAKKQRKVSDPLTKKMSLKGLPLSLTEYCVAKRLKAGKRSVEIAEDLNVSLRTVEWHRMKIRKKLGITGKKVSLFNSLQSYSE